MMTDAEIEKAIDAIVDRLDEVNTFAIRKVAAQMKKIGDLGPSSVHHITTMVDTGTSIREIETKLAENTGWSLRAVTALLSDVAAGVGTDPRFAAALKLDPSAAREMAFKGRLSQLAQTMARQTAQTMVNLSNTTAVSRTYQDAISRAVTAVASGQESYTAETRRIIREMGYGGMKVQYASGYRRRLDTAVRQNITNAVNQLAQQGSDLMGEELGYDAVEISAHRNSAPDHEPVQGRVFMRDQFDLMQQGLPFEDVSGRWYEGFKRPIGEWNCMHIAMSFSTKYSKPRWTEEQLQQMAEENASGCEIDGKHYTKYQADQLMRKIETDVRRWKDAANAHRIAGDDEGRRQCQQRINALVERYKRVSEASGLPQRKDRMRVEGFRMVKLPAN